MTFILPSTNIVKNVIKGNIIKHILKFMLVSFLSACASLGRSILNYVLLDITSCYCWSWGGKGVRWHLWWCGAIINSARRLREYLQINLFNHLFSILTGVFLYLITRNGRHETIIHQKIVQITPRLVNYIEMNQWFFRYALQSKNNF